MKTAQIMERKFRDGVIRQNHKTSWFNATDLLQVANQYRQQIGLPRKAIADYLKNDSTKEFIKEILTRENLSMAYESKKGKSGGTWVHPLILIDFAMWLSPDFKYEAIKWLQDELLKHRDSSGDSYKKLSSSIVSYYNNDLAKAGLVIPKIAKAIKKSLNVEDWNKTNEETLKKRDTIHNSITILLKGGVDIETAYKVAMNDVFGGDL
jgi:hypothetical protein